MMKKYFLMLAVFAATAFAMSSCETGRPETETETETTAEWKVDSAVYYGQKLAKGVGLYSVHFSKKSEDGKDVQRLKFDFMSSVSEADKIKPIAGDYKMAANDAFEKLTYITAAAATDEDGTIYMDNNTPVMITGGVVKLTVSAGGYRFANNLLAGDKTIDFVYSGNLKFIDRGVASAPREPIVADRGAIGYRGEYFGSSADLGIISLQLWSTKITDAILELSITAPMAKDAFEAEKVEIPVGTFNVVSKPTKPGEIVSGRIEAGQVMHSWESKMINIDGQNTFNGGIALTDGTITIEKTGDGIYTVQANLNGDYYTSNGKKQNRIEGVVYTLKDINFGTYMRDYSYPPSDLKADLNLTNLKNIFLDAEEAWAIQNTKLGLWRIILSEEKMSFSLNPKNDQEVYVDGEGDAMGVQVISSNTSTLPMGQYTMIKSTDEQFTDKMVYPSNAQASNLLAPFAGTGYFKIGLGEDNVYTNIVSACSMPDRGFVNITAMPEDKVKIDVEYYDKYGWKVTTSVEAKISNMVKTTRSMSSRFVPATTFIGLFNNGNNLQVVQ